MGWLFSKKKKEVPQAPVPGGKNFDERALQFPLPDSKISGKVIEPEDVKSAAGVNERFSFPSPERKNRPMFVKKPVMKETEELPAPKKFFGTPKPKIKQVQKPMPRPMPVVIPRPEPTKKFYTSVSKSDDFEKVEDHSYIKISTYQQILGEMDLLKDNLSNLSSVNKLLDPTDRTKENAIKRLIRPVKNTHDMILKVDKILFKV